jgi:hypothetical protein
MLETDGRPRRITSKGIELGGRHYIGPGITGARPQQVSAHTAAAAAAPVGDEFELGAVAAGGVNNRMDFRESVGGLTHVLGVACACSG